MRRVLGWVLVSLGTLGSCGLETVATLNYPPVNYADFTLVQDTRLSFIFSASNNTEPEFLGYEVYYKVYPASDNSTQSITNLLADRDSLAASPTIDRLTSVLGYSRLAVSAESSDSPNDWDYLLLQSLTDGDKVTLDFDEFVKSGSSGQPLLKIEDTVAAKGNLYRDVNVAGAGQQSFQALRTVTERKGDMASGWTPVQGTEFEVRVFIASVGVKATLEPLASKPVPWGVIRTIKP